MKISLYDIFFKRIIRSKIQFLYFEINNRYKNLFPTIYQIKRQRRNT